MGATRPSAASRQAASAGSQQGGVSAPSLLPHSTGGAGTARAVGIWTCLEELGECAAGWVWVDVVVGIAPKRHLRRSRRMPREQ